MKGRMPPPGTAFRLLLSDGSYGYCSVLRDGGVAVYGAATKEPRSTISEVGPQGVLFIVTVHRSAFRRWEAIGRGAVDESVARGDRFMQDMGNPLDCRIFDSEGHERPAKPADCIGLERVAAWDANHVEERLLDTLMGRPNRWVEQMKVKLPQCGEVDPVA